MKAVTRSPKFVSENEVRVTKAFLKRGDLQLHIMKQATI